MRWIAPEDGYDFWKREVQSHLYDKAKPHLGDYPDDYFYLAHEWQVGASGFVVVLGKTH